MKHDNNIVEYKESLSVHDLGSYKIEFLRAVSPRGVRFQIQTVGSRKYSQVTFGPEGIEALHRALDAYAAAEEESR